MAVNHITSSLAPYPMEELARIRKELVQLGMPVFDFGTGDPKIPTWAAIPEAIRNAIPAISQYPSVKGSDELHKAQCGYLLRRFGLQSSPDWTVIPSQGSKEAIFNIALILVGRSGGKRRILYPDPGYPVYKSSTLFAGGIPTPYRLKPEDDYLIKPWTLPIDIQRESAAVWVNYPHNPTGYMATLPYWQELIAWAHKMDVVILSDDCYVDIYDPKFDDEYEASPHTWDPRPICPLNLSKDRILTFMSLSKRSGMTGYRAGLIAGDTRIIQPFLRARANFGVGSPDFVQAGATVAWGDDEHVKVRRATFAKRMQVAGKFLIELGVLDRVPESTFYLWCKIPEKFGDDDVGFCLKLAQEGVITSPSQWLSEGIRGYVRFALVPDEDDTTIAMEIVQKFLTA